MKDISQMQPSHTRPVAAWQFEPLSGVICRTCPIMALAEQTGLLELAEKHLCVPTDRGANAGRKIGFVVAGMIAGADSIADLKGCDTGRWEPSSTARTHPQPRDRSCVSSPSGTSAK